MTQSIPHDEVPLELRKEWTRNQIQAYKNTIFTLDMQIAANPLPAQEATRETLQTQISVNLIAIKALQEVGAAYLDDAPAPAPTTVAAPSDT
jgi:hypothetical protein